MTSEQATGCGCGGHGGGAKGHGAHAAHTHEGHQQSTPEQGAHSGCGCGGKGHGHQSGAAKKGGCGKGKCGCGGPNKHHGKAVVAPPAGAVSVTVPPVAQAGVQFRAEPFTAEALARLEADASQIIARYPQPRSALLPLLHLVQSEQGYVSADGLEFCARTLNITPAQVAGVATFYSMYRRTPGGKYTVGVCTNPLCAVMGGDEIYARLRDHLGPEDNDMVSLEHLECNAACDYAPVVMVNWEFFDNLTPDSAVQLVDALLADAPPPPSRGASLRSFRETERVLAGFYDGRADEGVSAGPASLAGLRLAHGESAEPSLQEPAEVGSPTQATEEVAERAETAHAEAETHEQAAPLASAQAGRQDSPLIPDEKVEGQA